MRIVVDRLEGDLAILEVGTELVELPVAALPPGAGEGSVLKLVLDEGDEEALGAEA